MDGPVGELIRQTEISHFRPAHVHFLLDVPGFRPLITHLFEEGAEYLDSDVVFGTKQELVVGYEHHEPGAHARRRHQSTVPWVVGDLRLRAPARMTMRAVELHSPGEPPAVVDRAEPDARARARCWSG